jgi:Leucine-rich repeat (LRR) protein
VFAELTALESLTLSVNPLGRVPDELMSLRQLRFLDLSMCQLEALPADIAYWWPKLRRLGAQVRA